MGGIFSLMPLTRSSCLRSAQWGVGELFMVLCPKDWGGWVPEITLRHRLLHVHTDGNTSQWWNHGGVITQGLRNLVQTMMAQASTQQLTGPEIAPL